MSINGEVLGDCLVHLRRLINLTRYTSSFTIQIKNNYLVMSTGSTVKLTRPLRHANVTWVCCQSRYFFATLFHLVFVAIVHLSIYSFVAFVCLSICCICLFIFLFVFFFPVAFVFNWLFLLVKRHCSILTYWKSVADTSKLGMMGHIQQILLLFSGDFNHLMKIQINNKLVEFSKYLLFHFRIF